MSAPVLPASIPRKPPASTALDFHALRRLGLRFLDQIASGLWTDYNTHDPGITLLEAGAYGTTDAAYRTTFPDEVLFNPARSQADPAPPWPGCAAALGSSPLTANDFRRLLLDRFREIRQVWVETAADSTALFLDSVQASLSAKPVKDSSTVPLRGLWRIRLLFHPGLAAAEEERIRQEVFAVWHQHRRLGEDLDFKLVKVTDFKQVILCAEIQIAATAPVDATHAALVHALRQELNPALRRHTLAGLLRRGLATGQIFSGPELWNGFILEEDLAASEGGGVVRTSDLLRVIHGVPGVLGVGRFQLATPPDLKPGETKAEPQAVDWELPLGSGKAPQLELQEARFLFFKQGLPLRPNLDKVKPLLAELEAAARRAEQNVTCDPWPVPAAPGPGALDDFTTLQDLLPVAYGVGLRGYAPSASPERVAAARQLQAFLLIFDQMLANLAAQVEHAASLLSSKDTGPLSFNSAPVQDAPDLDGLIRSGSYAGHLADVQRKSQEATWIASRSRMMDHLLARWGETFTDAILEHLDGLNPEQVLKAKREFLAGIASSGYDRGRGAALADKDAVSALEQRLLQLLGLEKGRLLVIENFLLRPRGGDWPLLAAPCEAEPGVIESWDPYSFHIHLILEGETLPVSQPEFRQAALALIARELPAHLCPKTCFVSKTAFADVFAKWQACRQALADAVKAGSQPSKAAFEPLLATLAGLHTIYPYGTLHDCVEDQDEKGAIILGRSHLGTQP